MNRSRIVAITALLLLAPATRVRAQRPSPNQPDMTIDAETRSRVIDGVLKALEEEYVFPEVASKMDAAIREHQKAKDYDVITGAKAFAEKLTEHLQAVSHDKHLRVRYSHSPAPKRPEGRREPTEEDREQMYRFCAATNGGFEKVERLEGNVGLLKFNMFFPPEFAGEIATAAMGFVSSTDALIVDIRDNGGGDPSMVALVCSYVFGAEPVHLNDLYFRPANETHQFWTLPH